LKQEEIINGLLNRDIEVLEYVMDKYTNLLYTIVKKICVDARKEDIEEAVSDVFISVWKEIKTYDLNRASFKSWICMKAKFKALDLRRKISRKIKEVEFSDDISVGNVEDKVLQREEKEKLIEVIEKEPRINKDMFYQRYFYYRSIQDIAREYKMTQAAVSNRLYRMNNKIKNELSSYFEGE